MTEISKNGGDPVYVRVLNENEKPRDVLEVVNRLLDCIDIWGVPSSSVDDVKEVCCDLIFHVAEYIVDHPEAEKAAIRAISGIAGEFGRAIKRAEKAEAAGRGGYRKAGTLLEIVETSIDVVINPRSAEELKTACEPIIREYVEKASKACRSASELACRTAVVAFRLNGLIARTAWEVE